LIVFGDTPASFVISLYVFPFSANAKTRASFYFLFIIHILLVSGMI
jgi:hypothetical protein